MLVATARERARFGRSGIYDVRVLRGEEMIAEFRGRSRSRARRRGVATNDEHGAAPKTRRPATGRAPLPAGPAGRGRAADPRRARALQLSRLQHTVAARLRPRPAVQAEVRRGRRPPRRTAATLADLGQVPLHHQGRPARDVPLRHVRRAAGPRCAASTPPPAPPAAPPWSATPRTTSPTGPKLVARSHPRLRRPARHKVHNAYGYGLFTGGLGAHDGAEALGCTVIPISGGMTARQISSSRTSSPTSSWSPRPTC